MNPKIFDTDYICIDMGCSQITQASHFMAVPLYYEYSVKQNEYIRDLDAFIKKWYHDYDLSEKFSNNL